MPIRYPRLAEEPRVASKLLLSVVSTLNKKYKKTKNNEFQLSMMKNSVFSLERPYASSGIPTVDWAVCKGKGFPSGIIEIYGPESSAKSALVIKTLAEAQKHGWIALMFDAEYSTNYKLAIETGIDETNLIVLDAETIEDFYDELKDVVKEIRARDKNTPIIASWDSIASTQPRSEVDKDMNENEMAKMARQMSKFFRKLLRFLFMNKVCLLCVNQVRTNIGQRYGSPEVTTGGRALRFYAWVRCRMSQKEKIKDSNDKEIGIVCEMKVVKNKVGPPFKKCKIHVYWDHGIDIPASIWDWCIDNNVIKKKGTAYRFHKKIVTRRTFPKLYEANKELFDRLIREL